jgi:DNA-binding LacI/PurR family transcriptional regulator
MGGPLMITRKTLAEQTAAHLTRELQNGRWQGALPGVNRLSVELGVSRETLRAALGVLERQGLLQAGGGGRARMVTPNDAGLTARKSLRVAILLHTRLEDEVSSTQSLVLRIKHSLEAAGNICVFAPKSQLELKLDPARIIRLVAQTPADAWVVASGSLELLQWFEAGSKPVIAIGGRLKGLAIASASRNAIPAFREVFRHLIDLGHRRITLLCPRERRVPCLSVIERGLQEELALRNIPFGDFNVPDWEQTPEGLEGLLEALFRMTPPTAIQVSFPCLAIGVLAFLSRRGLRVPEDVSLICEHTDQTLAWYRPEIAHFTCDLDVILRRVVRWVAAVAQGRVDLRQISCPGVFHPGGSVMPTSPRSRGS